MCSTPGLLKSTSIQRNRPRRLKSTNLKSVNERLISFTSWPHKALNLDPRLMAVAGFYHQESHETSDLAICFDCNLELGKWQPNDDAMEEHRRKSPDCLYAIEMVEIFRMFASTIIPPPPSPSSTPPSPSSAPPSTTPTHTLTQPPKRKIVVRLPPTIPPPRPTTPPKRKIVVRLPPTVPPPPSTPLPPSEESPSSCIIHRRRRRRRRRRRHRSRPEVSSATTVSRTSPPPAKSAEIHGSATSQTGIAGSQLYLTMEDLNTKFASARILS